MHTKRLGVTLLAVLAAPLGAQTYIVTISGGRVVDRRREEEDDICRTETYEPI